MSLSDTFKRYEKAIAILRRLHEGDETAMSEIGPLLSEIDKSEAKHREEVSQRQAGRERRARTGRDKSGDFEISPQVEQGTDYGAKGIVLARGMGKRLVWRYSHTSYISRASGSRYFGPQLVVYFDPKDRHARLSQKLLLDAEDRKGFKLSRKLIMDYAKQIDTEFGDGVAVQVADLKATVLIGD